MSAAGGGPRIQAEYTIYDIMYCVIYIMCIIGRRWCSTSSAHLASAFSQIFSCHSGINIQRRRCGESKGEQEGGRFASVYKLD